jgi:cytochrome c
MAGAGPGRGKGRLVVVLLLLAVAAALAWVLIYARTPPASGSERTNEAASAEPAERPISYYLARADAARGEAYFARCAACHTIDQGGAAVVGPNLYGAMGAPIGQRPGYTYSAALSGHGGSWDWDAMSRFLKRPSAFAPGTRMTFYGVANPQDRADVMLYMNRQGGTLPPPAR